ncbi:hypothetical protein ACFU99_11910 [Streptomyces sp. NPDC057654]|uniref:hypothetical protein n=1 Tax=Streptomyces sp. NPDC057654 TaxID=3346196 RepID=UPI0036B16C07
MLRGAVAVGVDAGEQRGGLRDAELVRAEGGQGIVAGSHSSGTGLARPAQPPPGFGPDQCAPAASGHSRPAG